MNIDDLKKLSISELIELEENTDPINDADKLTKIQSELSIKKNSIVKSYATDSALDLDEPKVSRRTRLNAYIIDSLMLTLTTLPVFLYIGFERLFKLVLESPQEFFLWTIILNAIMYVLINGYTLFTSSQSLGKKFLKIRIDNLDGTRAGFLKIILSRYLPFIFLPIVPIVGSLIAFINPLLIFGHDSRCLHDYVAGTKVSYTE